MIDRSKVWTGALNDMAGVGMPDVSRVGLYDSTLRDGEQTVGVTLGPEDKLEIARALDRLGVDRIEAGFPRVSEEDAAAYELILEANLRSEVWGFSRALPADVEQLVQLGVRHAVIESPVSDGKLAAYGMVREKVLERVTDAVRWATDNGVYVCYFAVDSTRADLTFLQRVYEAALEAGATELAVVDTLGVAAPEAAAYLVGLVRSWVGPSIPLHWHGHNDFGLGVAGSLAAVRAGAMWIQGSINGMGERAGNANLAEVALALEALYGVKTGMRFEHIHEASELVRQRSGYELEPYKPITGRNLFVRETGAAVAQFHDPQAVEPYSSELTQAQRGVVLGKKSGLASIKYKLEELGVAVSDTEHATLLAAVKRLAIAKGSLVTDEEFVELVRGG